VEAIRGEKIERVTWFRSQSAHVGLRHCGASDDYFKWSLFLYFEY